MSVSLNDHHRRLHDLETALAAVLALVAEDRPQAAQARDAAARALRARGEAGAAALLQGQAAQRAYAR